MEVNGCLLYKIYYKQIRHLINQIQQLINLIGIKPFTGIVQHNATH